MRSVAATAALLLLGVACSSSPAPVTAMPHMDECGNPAAESMSWRLLPGQVTGVTSPSTFALRKVDGSIVTVTIANVGETALPDAVERLTKMLAGKTVSVLVNPSHIDDTSITGEVHLGNGNDVAHELLRLGITSYAEAPAYSLSQYSACVNRITEREARSRGVGIWRSR